jgi:hypothetical protein
VNDRARLLLSAQRALLGAVSANVAAVSIRQSLNAIRLTAHFYGPPDEDDVEAFRVVTTEILADFPDGHDIDLDIHVLHDGPATIDVGELLVFLRAGVKVSKRE